MHKKLLSGLMALGLLFAQFPSELYAQKAIQAVTYYPTPYGAYMNIDANTVVVKDALEVNTLGDVTKLDVAGTLTGNINRLEADNAVVKSLGNKANAPTIKATKRVHVANESSVTGITADQANVANTFYLDGLAFPYAKAIDPTVSSMSWKQITYYTDKTNKKTATRTFLVLDDVIKCEDKKGDAVSYATAAGEDLLRSYRECRDVDFEQIPGTPFACAGNRKAEDFTCADIYLPEGEQTVGPSTYTTGVSAGVNGNRYDPTVEPFLDVASKPKSILVRMSGSGSGRQDVSTLRSSYAYAYWERYITDQDSYTKTAVNTYLGNRYAQSLDTCDGDMYAKYTYSPTNPPKNLFGGDGYSCVDYYKDTSESPIIVLNAVQNIASTPWYRNTQYSEPIWSYNTMATYHPKSMTVNGYCNNWRNEIDDANHAWTYYTSIYNPTSDLWTDDNENSRYSGMYTYPDAYDFKQSNNTDDFAGYETLGCDYPVKKRTVYGPAPVVQTVTCCADAGQVEETKKTLKCQYVGNAACSDPTNPASCGAVGDDDEESLAGPAYASGLTAFDPSGYGTFYTKAGTYLDAYHSGYAEQEFTYGASLMEWENMMGGYVNLDTYNYTNICDTHGGFVDSKNLTKAEMTSYWRDTPCLDMTYNGGAASSCYFYYKETAANVEAPNNGLVGRYKYTCAKKPTYSAVTVVCAEQ
ncbi:hypothetical protein Dip510_001356 [Elusimicrobium posterum]|uniref:hypothetical protein n=1 Tax=Elusimicrobium posterum TaxID=3116653 RepID=UPI003C73B458